MLYPAELRAHDVRVPASRRGGQWSGLAAALLLAAPVGAGEEAAWRSVGEGLVVELADAPSLRLAELAPEVPAATLERWLQPGPLQFAVVGPAERDGHLPAMVRQGDEESLQARLVAAGLARVWPGHGDELAAELLVLEDEARAAGRGRWGSGEFRILDAVPPPAVEGFVILRGEVASVGRTDRFLYLNFDRRFREAVSVRVRPRDGRAWGLTQHLDDLVGRVVEVRGYAFEDGGPMLELDHPAQLRVVD